MEKTLTIQQPVTDSQGNPVFDADGNQKFEGRQVRFKSTGAFLLRYKAQFGRDALQDIFRLEDAIKINKKTKQATIKDLNSLDLMVFYNLVWTLAKTADPTIPEPLEWLDSFDRFPLNEILPETMELVTAVLGSTAENKKK